MLKDLTQDGTICDSPTALGTFPNGFGKGSQTAWDIPPNRLGNYTSNVNISSS